MSGFDPVIYGRLNGPVHEYFGLSYANYAVLHRTLMQSMPVGWQQRMVACLNELDDAYRHIEQPQSFNVKAGRFVDDSTFKDEDVKEPPIRFVEEADPVPHYNRGRTYIEPREDAHPELYCHRCGGPNVSWSAPSPLWNYVMRGNDITRTAEPHDGIVCPTCFAVLAGEFGAAYLWLLKPERVEVELTTTTPSGRVWDDEQGLWVDGEAPDAA